MSELFVGSEFSPKTQESVNLALDEIGKKLTYFLFVCLFFYYKIIWVFVIRIAHIIPLLVENKKNHLF